MYRLLIVEDESWIRMGLESTIDWNALGVELLPSAANGEEALAHISVRKPDIVLTDIRMPQMDGLELMDRLHEMYPEIMIIVISGYGDFRYAQKAIQYGAFSYVLKPIEESGLESEVRRCIQEIDARNSRYGALTGSLSKNSSRLREWLLGVLADGRDIVSGAEDVRVALVHIGWKDDVQTDAALLRVLRDSLFRYIHSMLGMALLAAAEMGEDVALLLDARDDARLSQLLGRLNIEGPSEHGFFVMLCVGDKRELSSDGRTAWKQVHIAAVTEKYASSLNGQPIDRTIRDFDEMFTDGNTEAALGLAERRISEVSAGGFGMETGVVALAYLMSIYRKLETENSVQFTRQFPTLIDSAFGIRSSDEMLAFLRQTTRQWLGEQTAVRAIVSEAVDYIALNLTDPELSLSDIAAALHTNHAYLSHAFKKDMNLNITEYIMQKRVEKSVRLIEDSGESLQQIACDVGYPNFQYFIRVFKKVMHTTPAQYRKSLQNQKS